MELITFNANNYPSTQQSFLPQNPASTFNDFTLKSIRACSNSSVPISSSAIFSKTRVHPYLRPQKATSLASDAVTLAKDLGFYSGSAIRRIRKSSLYHLGPKTGPSTETPLSRLPSISASGTQEYDIYGVTGNQSSNGHATILGEDFQSSSTTYMEPSELLFNPMESLANQIASSYQSLGQAADTFNFAPQTPFDFQGYETDTYSGYFRNELGDSQNRYPSSGLGDYLEEEPIYLGARTPSQPNYIDTSFEGWDATKSNQPAQQQDDYAPFNTSHPQHLYPHSIQYNENENFYYPQIQNAGQSFCNDHIDPALRIEKLEDFDFDFSGQELPQYNDSCVEHSLPVPEQKLKSHQKDKKLIMDEEAPVEFIFEVPGVTAGRGRKRRVSKKKRIRAIKKEGNLDTQFDQKNMKSADSRKLTRASWLAEAYAWKRHECATKSTRLGARYLVETYKAENPQIYESSDRVTVQEADLPFLPCPVAGCNTTWRGSKNLQSHLKNSPNLIVNPGHGLVVNNCKGQPQMKCEASGCDTMIARGARVRHLNEFHTNVWLYCTMCDVRMTRENQLQGHFRNEHEGEKVPKQFREIVHQQFIESSNLTAPGPTQ